MTITNTPSSSSALNLDTLPPPPSPTQAPSNPSSASAAHPAQSSAGSSLSDPSSVEDRRRRESSTRAWVAEQERRIEMEIIRTICSGRGDSLKPNSGTAITVGEHYVCVRSYDGSDPNYRTWEWHGHVLTGEDNGFVPERIYGSYLERLTEESWCDEEEDEERAEDSTFPIVIGNVNLSNMTCYPASDTVEDLRAFKRFSVLFRMLLPSGRTGSLWHRDFDDLMGVEEVRLTS